MDGVGLGDADPAVNPFLTARMPNLQALLGDGWFLSGRGRVTTEQASLVPTDANLNVAGKPQSATGQATILTGRNVPQIIGEHFGPKPDARVAEVIHAGTLFHEVVAQGGEAALLTPYPERFFAGIDRGVRLLSAVPLAATSAGLGLMTVDDLRAGRAVSPGFTGQAWRDLLGYEDVPIMTLPAAGQHLARLAGDYAFSFFEHWPSDRQGHRGTLAEAASHLAMIDQALGGLLAALAPMDETLLIITSDHGNIEDKSHRGHTRNPVPTILVGRDHADLAARVKDLTDIAGVVRAVLDLGGA